MKDVNQLLASLNLEQTSGKLGAFLNDIDTSKGMQLRYRGDHLPLRSIGINICPAGIVRVLPYHRFRSLYYHMLDLVWQSLDSSGSKIINQKCRPQPYRATLSLSRRLRNKTLLRGREEVNTEIAWQAKAGMRFSKQKTVKTQRFHSFYGKSANEHVHFVVYEFLCHMFREVKTRASR